MTAAVTAEVVDFGCRLNAFEGEVVRRRLAAAGAADTVVVNTCAVTAEAERQARQAIRRLRRERPSARIVVTGCAAQIDPAAFAAMPEVDQVVGNEEKLQFATWAAPPPGRIAAADIMTVRQTAGHLIDGMDGRARVFLEVQTGCDHRCTFCIIPFGRGPSRSVPAGAVVEAARRLVAAGAAEIVLSGVDLTHWGRDLPGGPTLGSLVRRLVKLVPELPRLRLSSLDPAEVDDGLWRAFAEEERLAPHLHFSVQAGSDLILKRMKRRHGRAEVEAACRRARALRPDAAIGADLIAGFPTETEAMFAQTLALVEECAIAWLHVFPYSARPGTPAARMPQVPGSVRRERAARLRAAGRVAADRAMAALLGRRALVLTEPGGSGRTEHYAPVRIVGADAAAGAMVPVSLEGLAEGRLIARPSARPSAPPWATA